MPMKTDARMNAKTRHSPMEHPSHQYPGETEALRTIVQSCGLTETIKWGKPCYTLEGKNIVLIQRFNKYIALMFFKGALLTDPDEVLFRIGEHMQAPRQLRFSSVEDVARLGPTITGYVQEAIRLEHSGAKVQRKRATDYELPDELEAKFNTDPTLRDAFAALTSGRQKSYIFLIGAAKQSTTRASRVEKYTPWILAGKGPND